MKRLVIMGSTGSIGRQTLDVVRHHRHMFDVVGLAAGRDVDMVCAQAREFDVTHLAVADEDAAVGADLPVAGGAAAVAELSRLDADIVVNGIDGAAGLHTTVSALQAGTPVALANKESLIIGGELVVDAATAAGGVQTHLLPVDSEHAALAQCLRGGAHREVSRLIVTASGGPFRGRSRGQMVSVTAEEALDHPTWSMGPLVTVNSSTLVNKGLELIEAHLLFDIGMDHILPVVHPQSVVHSMVEFTDGATLAKLSPPDMRHAIGWALGWPQRLDHAFVAMDWSAPVTLTFEPVDHDAFPALGLVAEAGRRAGSFPAVANGANEVAVAAFLDGQLGHLDIAATIEATLAGHDGHNPPAPRDIDDVIAADQWARDHARGWIAARRP